MSLRLARLFVVLGLLAGCDEPEPPPQPEMEAESELEPTVEVEESTRAAPPSRERFVELFGDLFEVVGFGERHDRVNPAHPQIELLARARAVGATDIGLRDPSSSRPAAGFRVTIQEPGVRELPPREGTVLLCVGDTLSIWVPIEPTPFEWLTREGAGASTRSRREVLGPLSEDDLPVGPFAHQLAPLLVNPERVRTASADDWALVRFEAAEPGTREIPGVMDYDIEVVEAGTPVTVPISATMPLPSVGPMRPGDVVFVRARDFVGPDLNGNLPGLEGL